MRLEKNLLEKLHRYGAWLFDARLSLGAFVRSRGERTRIALFFRLRTRDGELVYKKRVLDELFFHSGQSANRVPILSLFCAYFGVRFVPAPYVWSVFITVGFHFTLYADACGGAFIARLGGDGNDTHHRGVFGAFSRFVRGGFERALAGRRRAFGDEQGV